MFDDLIMTTYGRGKIDNFIDIDLNRDETINAASKILFDLGEKYPRWVDKNYEKLIISYTQNLLTLIDKTYPIEKIFDDRISKTVKFIHENIDKQITVEQLAALCCVEKNYSVSETAELVGYSDGASFSHTFKKEYGISPGEYR